jgi:chromosome partitioning protein
MRGSCSVCGAAFDVQFRYQMEERNGGFSFYCSQKCLQASQKAGVDGAVACDGCATYFRVELVSQVLYMKGQRKYACTIDCRNLLLAESRGLRLGDLALPGATHEGANDVTASGSTPAPPATLPSPSSELLTEAPAPLPISAMAPQAPAPTSLPATIGGTVPTLVSAGAPSVAPASSAPVPVSVVTAPRAVPSRSVPPPAPSAPPAPVAAAPAAQPVSMSPKIKTTQPAPAVAPTSDLPRMIAVFNHKGGTGKTTTSVSLAAGLAMRGKKVLLVDTDAQGNVSVSLGVKAERSLYHVLVMGLAGKDSITNVRPNLDLIPSNETLAAAELYLAGRQNRDRVLATRLASLVTQYDYVVVDCSPSLSLMNQNALCLVDSVLVPVACDYLSLVGMRQVIKTVKNVNQLLHHPVRIWGVLPTFYDMRAKICNEAIDTLTQHFGPRCLRPIRQAIKVKEAPAQGQTIFEYAAGTQPAEDYNHLVRCVLGEIALSTSASAGPQSAGPQSAAGPESERSPAAATA